jgi:AcrR family transcriptional regulator
VAPGAPYHHFPDKNALLLALAQGGFEALGVALSEATMGEEDPVIRLRQMIETYLYFSVAHGPHYRLMFPKEAGEPGSSWHGIAMASFQRLAMAVAAVRTDLPPERVMMTATTVWALCHGVVILRLDGLLPDREPFPCLKDLVARTNEAAIAVVRGA